MRIFIFSILIVSLIGCEGNYNRRSELDSLLRSEDSTRMTNDLIQTEIDYNSIDLTNDPDIDFAKLMFAFYQAELKASQIEIRKGRDSNVIRIAQEQMEHHSKDISLFDDYSHNQNPSRFDSGFTKNFFIQLKQMQVIHHYPSFDEQFLALLISHHEKGIELSKGYLKYAGDAFMRLKANHIIEQHTKEVTFLNRFLLE